jgi:subtilisin family serine protease
LKKPNRSPHVAGIAALIWGERPELTPLQLRELIKKMATVGAMKEIPSGTVNRLAYVGFNNGAN